MLPFIGLAERDWVFLWFSGPGVLLRKRLPFSHIVQCLNKESFHFSLTLLPEFAYLWWLVAKPSLWFGNRTSNISIIVTSIFLWYLQHLFHSWVWFWHFLCPFRMFFFSLSFNETCNFWIMLQMFHTQRVWVGGLFPYYYILNACLFLAKTQ